jgi:hypothetical protein
MGLLEPFGNMVERKPCYAHVQKDCSLFLNINTTVRVLKSTSKSKLMNEKQKDIAAHPKLSPDTVWVAMDQLPNPVSTTESRCVIRLFPVERCGVKLGDDPHNIDKKCSSGNELITPGGVKRLWRGATACHFVNQY